MKIKKTLALLAFSAILFVGCKDTATEKNKEETTNEVTSNETSTSNEVAGKMEKATFEIEGMSCAVGCAKVIEGKLTKLNGVKSAVVDFETKTATVEFDNAKQTITTIEETVEKIANGAYKVENMHSSLETAMLFDQEQEPKQEKKSCCSKSEKSCDKKDKKDESKSDKKNEKSEKKASLI